MRAKRLVSTFSVTPIAEMRNIGVSATWIRCAMSTDWAVKDAVPMGLPNVNRYR